MPDSPHPTQVQADDAPRVLIIGGGIAGVGCALWLRSFEVPFRWVDASGRVGGTLHRVHHPIYNYPGLACANGAFLADRLAAQVAEAGATLEQACVDRIALGRREVVLDGVSSLFRFIVLATGTSPRRLRVPGESELEGTHIFWSTHNVRDRVADQHVAVIGGGDGAFEGALILAEAGARVTIVHRAERPRARKNFRDRVQAHAAIAVVLESAVRSIERHDDELVLRLQRRGEEMDLQASYIVCKVGVEPTLPPLDGPLARIADGYVRVDRDGRTSAPGVFAAGDLTSPFFQCVTGGAAQGAQVAAAIARALAEQG